MRKLLVVLAITAGLGAAWIATGWTQTPAAKTPIKVGVLYPFKGPFAVLGELQLQPDGSWDAGWIYDPKVGKSYSVAVQIEDRNTLVVTGYRGIKLLGKSFAWTRAPGDLPRCLLAKEAGAPPPPAPTPAQRRP